MPSINLRPLRVARRDVGDRLRRRRTLRAEILVFEIVPVRHRYEETLRASRRPAPERPKWACGDTGGSRLAKFRGNSAVAAKIKNYLLTCLDLELLNRHQTDTIFYAVASWRQLID